MSDQELHQRVSGLDSRLDELYRRLYAAEQSILRVEGLLRANATLVQPAPKVEAPTGWPVRDAINAALAELKYSDDGSSTHYNLRKARDYLAQFPPPPSKNELAAAADKLEYEAAESDDYAKRFAGVPGVNAKSAQVAAAVYATVAAWIRTVAESLP